MFKLCFFIPESHVEVVKKALFKKGAGRIGQYDYCSWQVLGEGQFRPLKGSNPYLGKENTVEKVPEYKVEMVCEDDLIEEVVKELKRTHPYEEPAFEIYQLYNTMSSK